MNMCFKDGQNWYLNFMQLFNNYEIWVKLMSFFNFNFLVCKMEIFNWYVKWK